MREPAAQTPRQQRKRPPATSRPKRRKIGALCLVAGTVVSLLGLTGSPAAAGSSNHDEPVVEINPGGGAETDGSDGIRILMNGDESTTPHGQLGQDQLFFADTYQYCCSASAPMLNIGGTLYGEAGPAGGGTSWASLEILGVTGSGTTSGGSDTGNGTATLRYTASHGELDYVVDRMVSYTHPNRFMTDEYTITIPEGNTEVVKFYLGGDTAPGSSDSGVGVMLTDPVRTVYSVNPISQIQLGFGEIPGEAPFDGALAISFFDPYDDVAAGADIGFAADPGDHDAGIMIQWTIGTEAGEHERALRHFVGPRGASLEASFRETVAVVGEPVTVDLSIVNTGSDPAADLDFDFELPSGLVVGSGAAANSCGGTLTATAGTALVSLVDGEVAQATNCLVSLPVVAASAGDYVFTGASVTAISGLENAVGTSTLTVNDPPGPGDTCPTDHGWDVVADQVERLYGATIGRAADVPGLVYWTQHRLWGMPVHELAGHLLGSAEWTEGHGQQSNEAFVDTLYQQVLGRMADDDGKAFWVGLLDGGLSRTTLVLAFSDSVENVTRTGTRLPMSDSQSLTCRLYQTLLHRSPDDDGFTHWTSHLDAGSSPTAIAAFILATNEAMPLAQLPDGDFVDSLYQGALGRSADPDGKTYWTGLIDDNGRPAVATWLANAYEYGGA
jgi:hypothetical protein